MSTDDPSSFLGHGPGTKSVKKPHWRGKLFSKDRNNKGTTDQQIEAFLAPNRSISVSHGSHPSGAPPRGQPRPRLEISQQWPFSQEPSSLSPISNPSPATDSYPPSFPIRKTRARKGLKVRFSDKMPEVIGEGGDESEAPTMEISLSRGRQRSQHPNDQTFRTENSPQTKQPQLRLDTSVGDTDGYVSRPGTNQRKNTIEGMKAADFRPLLKSPQDADLLMALNLNSPGSRLSFRASPDSNSYAQRVRAKMQAEEGRALQHGYHDEPPSPAAEVQKPAELSPESPSSLYETPPISEIEPTPPTNYLRKPPSPIAYRQGNSSPVELHLPSAFPSGGGARNLSPPKPQSLPKGSPPDALSRPSSGESRDASRSPQPPKVSLRAVASQFGDTAFIDLKAYIAQYTASIRLSAGNVKPLMETSLAEWMRAATWWFLCGRKRLEVYARSRPSSSNGRTDQCGPPEIAKQAVIDLGKALWIGEDIIPQLSEITRYGNMSIDALLAVASTTGDKQLAEFLGLHQTIMNYLRSLAMSIKRNNILSTLTSGNYSAIHADTSVWVRYPFFAPDVSAVLSGLATRSMLVDNSGKGPNTIHMMPVGDTSRYFSYGSMFVEACVSSSEDDSQQFSMPCALSILRDRADWYVCAAITSQSELVNIKIQSDRKKGPTWDDVDWQVRSHSMRVKLPRGFELDVMFQEDDFKNLWNIVQYTLKTEASLQPEAGEHVIFDTSLKVFHYMDPGTPKSFPAEPIERCRLRLFERSVTVTGGTGSRNVHQGFRLTVLTSPKVKTLSSVRHIIGYGTPIVFGLLRGEGGAPALMLKVTEDGRTRSMLMTFQEVQERATLHSLLLGMVAKEREFKISDIPIRTYTIEQPLDKASGQPAMSHLKLPAGKVTVFDQEHDYVEHQYGPTILSEHLRAFVASEWGSVTDRINLGPGELRLGLDVSSRTGLSLYRPAQQDMTVSLADNLVPPEMPETLTSFLQTAMIKPMVRRFDFASINDLHTFQAAVTGFNVLFDSVASSFMISRRRMVVPIYKKWEASRARVQIVQQEKVVQLVAFLSDFSHGRCMNFVLKGTDTIESFTRSGKFSIRIVDAKFALPKTDDDPASDFVCLDMPEYPIEHDDITIAFDSEADRSRFEEAVPGSVREPSRMASLRR